MTTHPADGTDSAAELLVAELADDFRARQARGAAPDPAEYEARAAAALDHPHIVKVHAVGENRGTHYLAMQFIAGRPLSDLIRERQAAAAPTGRLPASPDAPTVTNAAADSVPDTDWARRSS